jgi:4'-phosphopantetheinyl transferase EntD
VIEDVLPSCVATAEAFDDREGGSLFPEEEMVVARAVRTRRSAFTTGRRCARRALGELGLSPVAIPVGVRGAPQWPAGIVGSITHCDGFRASAVAHAEQVLTVGIDAEPNGPLPPSVLPRIALAEEQLSLRALATVQPQVHWDRLLFSAKEAVYKAWYPLTGSWLGFTDALLAFDPSGGTFFARLLVPGPVLGGRRLRGFAGRWLVRRGLVVSAIALPHRNLHGAAGSLRPPPVAVPQQGNHGRHEQAAHDRHVQHYRHAHADPQLSEGEQR